MVAPTLLLQSSPLVTAEDAAVNQRVGAITLVPKGDLQIPMICMRCNLEVGAGLAYSLKTLVFVLMRPTSIQDS